MSTLLYIVGVIVLISSFFIPFGTYEGLIRIIINLLYTGPVALILFGVATLIERVESMEEYIRTTHEVEELNKLSKESTSKKWRCHGCGRENAMYVGTCGCGKKRDEM